LCCSSQSEGDETDGEQVTSCHEEPPSHKDNDDKHDTGDNDGDDNDDDEDDNDDS
jgi:hypothetical protein